MKEHIKKFPTIASADGHVIDAPFIASVAPATEGAAPTNIQCAESGKKIQVSNGVINIVNASVLISFTISSYHGQSGDESQGGDVTYTAESGMTLAQWLTSDYNTSDWYIEDPGWVRLGRWSEYLDLESIEGHENAPIVPDHTYTTWLD